MTNLPIVPSASQARACGACSLCCDLFPVPELMKDAGEPCRHCNPPHGCGIHATRPAVCRSFDCAWLRGHGRLEDRPDRTGVFVAGTAILAGRKGTLCYGLAESADSHLTTLTEMARRTNHPVFLLIPPRPGDAFGGLVTCETTGEVRWTAEPVERFSWRNARPAEPIL